MGNRNGQSADISIHAPRTGSDGISAAPCDVVQTLIYAARTGRDLL